MPNWKWIFLLFFFPFHCILSILRSIQQAFQVITVPAAPTFLLSRPRSGVLPELFTPGVQPRRRKMVNLSYVRPTPAPRFQLVDLGTVSGQLTSCFTSSVSNLTELQPRNPLAASRTTAPSANPPGLCSTSQVDEILIASC